MNTACNRSKSHGALFCAALAAAGILWGALFALNPRGVESRVFFERGNSFFADFVSVRTCAEYGYANAWYDDVRAWRRGTAAVALAAAVALKLTPAAGVLLVPGNMHVYTGLYLMPALALRLQERMGWFEALCWFALLCPLQIPLGAGCLNHPIANLAFLVLVDMSLRRSARRVEQDGATISRQTAKEAK